MRSFIQTFEYLMILHQFDDKFDILANNLYVIYYQFIYIMYVLFELKLKSTKYSWEQLNLLFDRGNLIEQKNCY